MDPATGTSRSLSVHTVVLLPGKAKVVDSSTAFSVIEVM